MLKWKKIIGFNIASLVCFVWQGHIGFERLKEIMFIPEGNDVFFTGVIHGYGMALLLIWYWWHERKISVYPDYQYIQYELSVFSDGWDIGIVSV